LKGGVPENDFIPFFRHGIVRIIEEVISRIGIAEMDGRHKKNGNHETPETEVHEYQDRLAHTYPWK
jgi:hypothetical protein